MYNVTMENETVRRRRDSNRKRTVCTGRKLLALLLSVFLAAGTAGCGFLAYEKDAGSSGAGVHTETTTPDGSGNASAGGPDIAAGIETDLPENETGPKETEAAPYIPDMTGRPWVNSMLAGELDPLYHPGPEEDFFLYVNRNWLEEAELWPGYGMNLSLMDNMFSVQQRMEALLRPGNGTGQAEETGQGEEPSMGNETDPEDKAGPGAGRGQDGRFRDASVQHDTELAQNLYELFLDWDGRNEAGTAEFEKHLRIVDRISSLEGLSTYLCSEEPDFWGRGLVTTITTTNPGQADSHVLEVDLSSIFLSDSADYFQDTENGRREKALTERIAVYMLEQLGYADRAQEILDQCLIYEAAIAEKVPTRAESTAPGYSSRIYNIMDRRQLAGELQHFPLQRFLDARGFGKADRIMVMLPDALRRLDEMYLEENLEYFKSYILAHMAYSATDVLTEDIFRETQKIRREMSGTEVSPADEDEAYNLVMRSLPSPMAHIYADAWCTEEERQRITGLTERIIRYYEEMLRDHTEWLTEETRAAAVEKLRAIRVFAVYPDAWQDYSSLRIRSPKEGGTLLQALEAINHYNLYYNGGQLNSGVEREYWPGCIDTNAYYNAMKNSIYICAGFIGDFLYYEGIPEEELFAGLGSVIGHEISHAFDTIGAQFDKDGNLNSWWTQTDYRNFLERAQRLTDYYDRLDPLENGEPYLGAQVAAEVIADMGGMKAMLGLAGQQRDFDYDLFFRSYARIWRGLYSREEMIKMLAEDSHPPGYIRANVTLMQYDEFLETYGIREGDRMYMGPEERIAVW